MGFTAGGTVDELFLLEVVWWSSEVECMCGGGGGLWCERVRDC